MNATATAPMATQPPAIASPNTTPPGGAGTDPFAGPVARRGGSWCRVRRLERSAGPAGATLGFEHVGARRDSRRPPAAVPPMPLRVRPAVSRSGEVVPSGDDGPANRFTSHTRRIVMTTARATPANASEDGVDAIHELLSRRATTLGGGRSATGARQSRRIRTRSMDSSPPGVDGRQQTSPVGSYGRGITRRGEVDPVSARTESERPGPATIGGG